MKFFCDLDYDPFLLMEDTKKVYGQLPVFFLPPIGCDSLQVSRYLCMNMDLQSLLYGKPLKVT